MKKSLVFFCTMLLTFSFIGDGHAAYIVNTGPGPTSIGGYPALYRDSSGYQYLAGEFIIDQSYTVTDIEGWIYNNSESNSTATVVIYGDDNSLPNSNEIYSQRFNVASQSYDFSGASGLSWYLGAGTYWLAFEVRTNDTLQDGWMPTSNDNPASPLDKYAFNYNGEGWQSSVSTNFAARVQADAVPIPGAFWLLGSGLISIVGIRRKIKK